MAESLARSSSIPIDNLGVENPNPEGGNTILYYFVAQEFREGATKTGPSAIIDT